MPQEVTFTVEDAVLRYKNFEGREGQYNRAGDRNFNIVLSPEDAAQLAKDGWNVREQEPQEEGDDPTYLLEVKVGYKGRPPKIVMLSSSGRTNLTEETVETLDYADLKQVDLIVRAYHWEVNGKTGIKAYLKSLFAILNEDELDLKYANWGAKGSYEEDEYDG